ncbi:hypothetical protein BVC93_06170 [Mycobacterium sp. MS1601]|uniref:LpqN/LpqT family lipoprotein n=1 Tax=Mycobacterium sp. MS1601 TaxID=1936029 RepID=UPI00097962E2|nr:LpqN/LpqT family lipoprotein [Mycobacterium sp. MS1601]AQA02081.1 hypothetical protein BVC93_06170 [Mycobacterium sp. MS1601]
MKKFTSVAGAGVTALALGLALVGCGSDSSTEATSSSSSAEESTAESTSAAAESTEPAAPAGPNETIQDYIVSNGIQESTVKRGDPGVPVVNMPVPPGWQQRDNIPEAPFGAIVFTGTAVPANPPRILALMSKLTGDVDPQAILDYAPGELENMPGWQPMNPGTRNQLSGFDAFQIAGAYAIDGRKGMIAQKTVVIPADDGVYVLQLNAYSDEQEAPVLGNATQVIDEQTTITFE